MAALARGFLRSRSAVLLSPLGWLYGKAASANRARLSARQERLPAPVISVGNITCGGTGKTPVAEMLARDLLARGRRPAILSRGYRSGPDRPGDETLLLARNLPSVAHYPDPDRLRSGRAAVAAGADVLILDDGFQHARVARDLDLVLIDALDPFGGHRVLPAGLLREPLSALAGAGILAITRAGLVPPVALGILRGILRDRFPRIPRMEIEIEPLGFEPLGGGELLEPRGLAGKRAAGFAGVGNPESFRRQLLEAGLEVVSFLSFPDHHPYRPRDLAEIRRRAAESGAEVVVTTQKDAVKLPAESGARGQPWLVLRIAARAGAGAAALSSAVERALSSAAVEGRP
jgi:tetraacyldisaccharide 4'-kinase